jgi:transposase
MKKHTYRTKNVNKINWTNVIEKASNDPLVFAIDVAKQKQFALLSNASGTVSELVSWNHPEQTPDMIKVLESFSGSIDVIMESTGTYGDALRYQFRLSGFGIYQVSGKRVSDAQEVFDGVNSMHDAKAATLITHLHRSKLSQLWVESSEDERDLNALQREYELHQSQHQRNKNRLEATLARHWPEVGYLLDLGSITLENLLIDYGTPEQIAQDKDAAAEKMRGWGKSYLKQEKIEKVINSALKTLGQPCTDIEKQYIQALAKEMQHSRLQKKQAKQALETLITNDKELLEMGKVIGLVTTAVLLSYHLDPRKYSCASSYLKALGLNLKEKSSGQHIGQLKLTKRGSSIARKYLYFAALRLIQFDSIAKAWYESKVDPRAKNKTVIAVLRKLAKSLWYVGRGERFDASKLFKVIEA